MVVSLVSWPGMARPSTTGGADRGKVVDSRHKHALGRAGGPARGAGHDTMGATAPQVPYFNAYGAAFLAVTGSEVYSLFRQSLLSMILVSLAGTRREKAWRPPR